MPRAHITHIFKFGVRFYFTLGERYCIMHRKGFVMVTESGRPQGPVRDAREGGKRATRPGPPVLPEERAPGLREEEGTSGGGHGLPGAGNGVPGLEGSGGEQGSNRPRAWLRAAARRHQRPPGSRGLPSGGAPGEREDGRGSRQRRAGRGHGSGPGQGPSSLSGAAGCATPIPRHHQQPDHGRRIWRRPVPEAREAGNESRPPRVPGAGHEKGGVSG